jgi:hypothetical protein
VRFLPFSMRDPHRLAVEGHGFPCEQTPDDVYRLSHGLEAAVGRSVESLDDFPRLEPEPQNEPAPDRVASEAAAMAVEAALRPWMPAIPVPTRIEPVAAAIAAQATKGSAPVVSAARTFRNPRRSASAAMGRRSPTGNPSRQSASFTAWPRSS